MGGSRKDSYNAEIHEPLLHQLFDLGPDDDGADPQHTDSSYADTIQTKRVEFKNIGKPGFRAGYKRAAEKYLENKKMTKSRQRKSTAVAAAAPHGLPPGHPLPGGATMTAVVPQGRSVAHRDVDEEDDDDDDFGTGPGLENDGGGGIRIVQAMMPQIPPFEYTSSLDMKKYVTMYFIPFSGMQASQVKLSLRNRGKTARIVYTWPRALLQDNFVQQQGGPRGGDLSAMEAHRKGLRILQEHHNHGAVISTMDYNLPCKCSSEFAPDAYEIIQLPPALGGGALLKVHLKAMHQPYAENFGATVRAFGEASPHEYSNGDPSQQPMMHSGMSHDQQLQYQHLQRHGSMLPSELFDPPPVQHHHSFQSMQRDGSTGHRGASTAHHGTTTAHRGATTMHQQQPTFQPQYGMPLPSQPSFMPPPQQRAANFSFSTRPLSDTLLPSLQNASFLKRPPDGSQPTFARRQERPGSRLPSSFTMPDRSTLHGNRPTQVSVDSQLLHGQQGLYHHNPVSQREEDSGSEEENSTNHRSNNSNYDDGNVEEGSSTTKKRKRHRH